MSPSSNTKPRLNTAHLGARPTAGYVRRRSWQSRCKSEHRFPTLPAAFLLIGLQVLPTAWAFAQTPDQPAGQQRAQTVAPEYMLLSQETADPTLNPHQTVGFQACLKCHQSEVGVWSLTWHHTSDRTLHRSDEAQAIASRLGLDSVKYSQRCIKCHYTPVMQSGDVSITAAVSCECCHGAGKSWWNNHFPPETKIAKETSAERSARIAKNIKNGMRNRHNTYTMARICMRCHNVGDEELVNVGGHNLGGKEFEMVSWSQGMMRHRFVSGGGQRNAPNPPERLAMIFVSGIIADLEFSLRATANATTNDSFGQQAAQRAAKAAKRLTAVAELTNLQPCQQILAVYGTVELRTNNRQQLLTAAEKIRKIGVRFGAEYDGTEFMEAVKPYVPKPRQWVFD